MTDDGVPVPINTAPKSQYGASTATNGHWLHDLAGPAQYVPAPQDCGKAIAPDLQAPASRTRIHDHQGTNPVNTGPAKPGGERR